MNKFEIRICLKDQNNSQIYGGEESLPFDRDHKTVALNQCFQDLTIAGYEFEGSQIFHVNQEEKLNIFLGIYPFSHEVSIAIDPFNAKEIHMVVRSEEAKEGIKKNVEKKHVNVKERTIQEAMDYVAKWKQFHDMMDMNGKKLYTLEEAALKAGVAKKTLDDYKNHFRDALKFNFDLERFKHSKMGILRKFIKIGRKYGKQYLNLQMSKYMAEEDISKYWMDLNESEII